MVCFSSWADHPSLFLRFFGQERISVMLKCKLWLMHHLLSLFIYPSYIGQFRQILNKFQLNYYSAPFSGDSFGYQSFPPERLFPSGGCFKVGLHINRSYIVSIDLLSKLSCVASVMNTNSFTTLLQVANTNLGFSRILLCYSLSKLRFLRSCPFGLYIRL